MFPFHSFAVPAVPSPLVSSTIWAYVLILILLSMGSVWAGERSGSSVRRHTLKELRDQYVVKQQLDYSCGAAALATLLTYYFGDETSERELLELLTAQLPRDELERKERQGFSLLDLKQVAQAKGYQAAGFKLTIEQLTQPTRAAACEAHDRLRSLCERPRCAVALNVPV